MRLPEHLEALDKKRIERPAETARELWDLVDTFDTEREIYLSLGIYGSCMRHMGDIREAIRCLNEGLRLAEDDWDRAHLLQRRSLAIGATGDFEVAFLDSGQALLGYLRAADFDAMGRVLSNQAMWHYHSESFSKCIQFTEVALQLLHETSIEHRFVCHQYGALALIETEQHERCLEELERAGSLVGCLSAIAGAKFRWAESKVVARAGRPELAEQVLRDACSLFWETENAFDGALASLALVENLLTQGKLEEAYAEGIECRKYLVKLPESTSLHRFWPRSGARRTGKSCRCGTSGLPLRISKAGAVWRPPRLPNGSLQVLAADLAVGDMERPILCCASSRLTKNQPADHPLQ